MHPIRLNKEVNVKGRSLYGRKSQITFYPLNWLASSKWYWESRINFLVPINLDIIDLKTRRTRLNYENHKLEVFEHIGVLRWFGLCRLIIKSDPWPPYYGRSIELWQSIKEHCEEDESEEINWYTLTKEVKWTYPGLRNNQLAFTEIRPSTKKRLELKIISSYPGLGSCEINFIFPDKERLERLCSSRSQGWPPILYHLLKLPAFFGWPHHKKFIWVQNYGKDRTLVDFTHHRALDLLGLLSLICRDGLLSADVISVCSGHEADINTILKADKLLYRLK